jgi:hypothetical protein
MSKGWIIGEYTGDSYKDLKITAGTATLASNLATVTTDGAIVSAVAVGTTSAAELGIRCSSSVAQLAAGSAIFAGSASATDTIHYFIVSSGKV